MEDQEPRDYLMIIGVFDLISRQIREKVAQVANTGKPLAVGVLTDDYVINELSTMPLKSTKERMEVASGLEGVSFVFPAESNITSQNISTADDFYKKYLATKKEESETNKEKKYRVGIVIGSFDLYHSGHHQNLELAHKKCDHLYILLKSSARILQKKGVMPQQNDEIRAGVLRALKVVDDVIPYDVDSTRKLAIKDVIQKHYNLYNEILQPSDIVAIFGEDLRQKETERYNAGDWFGINIAFTPREEEKMNSTYIRNGVGYIGKGISSSCYRKKIEDESKKNGISTTETYSAHTKAESEGLTSELDDKYDPRFDN